MATVVRFVAVISVAVSIAGSAHGSTTCDTCKCPLSNVEIINSIINARINATVMSRMEEFTVSFEERMNTTLDEEMSTINATLSILSMLQLMKEFQQSVPHLMLSMSKLCIPLTGF